MDRKIADKSLTVLTSTESRLEYNRGSIVINWTKEEIKNPYLKGNSANVERSLVKSSRRLLQDSPGFSVFFLNKETEKEKQSH